MKSWLNRLLAPRQDAAAAPPRATLPAQREAANSQPAPHELGDQAAWDMPLLAWMANGPSFVVGPAGPREQAALQHLDQLLADTSAHHRVLPRAAAVIPPLMARLRSPDLSLADLSEHISRDMALTTEIIRMANSAHYRRETAVVELEHAVRLLGVEGLRVAIARAVLKPLIDVRSGKLVACSAARLWEHTDRKAQLCSALARGAGLEPFEGCLAGLAHNAVWSTVMRALDEVNGEHAWRLSPAFATALGARRDRLFAIVAQQWQLADGLAQAASDMATQDLAADASAATRLLYTGDRLAWLLCSPDRARAAQRAEQMLHDAEPALRNCFKALQQAPRQSTR